MQNIEQKIKKIGAIIGQKVVFSIGVDAKEKRVDLIDIKVCHEEDLMTQDDGTDYVG